MTISRQARSVAAIVVVLVAAAALTLWSLNGPHVVSGIPSALAPAVHLDPPPAAPAKKPPALPHDPVAASAPTSFTITGPGFSVQAAVCGMDPVFPLDPPGDQLHTVCWVTHGFGVAPASRTSGTTYVLGHAWAQQQLVLNPLSEFATAHEAPVRYQANGVAINAVPALRNYRITLQTATGTLGYTVTTAFLVGKLDARGVASLMQTSTPNRLVVITCAVADHVDLPQNVIVYANLAWSKAKH